MAVRKVFVSALSLQRLTIFQFFDIKSEANFIRYCRQRDNSVPRGIIPKELNAQRAPPDAGGLNSSVSEPRLGINLSNQRYTRIVVPDKA